jgi:hypothetical protein
MCKEVLRYDARVLTAARMLCSIRNSNVMYISGTTACSNYSRVDVLRSGRGTQETKPRREHAVRAIRAMHYSCGRHCRQHLTKVIV